ncbi:uncharacterized mitochondrial protein AtMg00810-like [Nicotiana tomentosiformis]|uniref:uncharacterized mitochondrial protein AtMg00810-like n=1 Tax=Nicotiana tomentosiformis TaxID=4098 RepID=UPI00388C5BF7
MVTVRSVIAVAPAKHWHIFQMDVHNAFLQGDLLEEVYMDITQGSCPQLIMQTRCDLQLKFKMKDLGELKFFLGIEFARSREGIIMNHRKYSLELIAKLGLGGAKPASAPLEHNQKLTSADYGNFINTQSTDKDNAHTDHLLPDASQYQRLVGRLVCLTMTRADIAFAVQVLIQFMHKPKQSHMEVALRVVRYIKSAPGLGLMMPSENSGKLRAYYDSDWGGCVQTRKSVIGYLVKFGNALVSWKSKKQDTVARSSAKAEFRSMASVVVELTWLTRLYKELEV